MTFNFKSRLKSIIRYLKNYNSLEIMLLNFMLIFGLIFSKFGYVVALVFFGFVLIHRIVKRKIFDSILTLKLFSNGYLNKRFTLMGVLNIFMLFTMSILDYNFFETYLTLLVFRIMFGAENTYIQNYLLNGAIEELYNFGETIEISNLASFKTKRTLQMLGSIKEEIKDSVNRSMKTERLKTELITNISHDLKTPLTSIINYTDILSKKTVMDEEAKEYINVLGRNSERLRALIIDLIYASKTGSGAIKVEKVFLDFNELVSQIYGDFDEVLSLKDLEFVYDYDSEINIYTDPGIVSRIVQNLISNAYKYSKLGTKIIAQTKVTDEQVCFEMKNEAKEEINGDENDLINELVKSEKARSTEGSGLGLYITKNLAEILGGEFHIEIEGQEFTAKVTLPREN